MPRPVKPGRSCRHERGPQLCVRCSHFEWYYRPCLGRIFMFAIRLTPYAPALKIFDLKTETWSLTASMTQLGIHTIDHPLMTARCWQAGGYVPTVPTSVSASAERFYPGAAPPQITISSNVATMNFTVACAGLLSRLVYHSTTLLGAPGSSCP